MNWQQAISHCHHAADPFAVVTVIATTGSTPREGSAKMVVTHAETFDTIGGGQLEFKVIESARAMLALRAPSQRVEHFPLATKAQQCCGGSVSVLIESFPVTARRIAVFGAGHVASALMQILAQCDTRLEWIDNRPDVFPKQVSGNVQLVETQDPVGHVDTLSDLHRCIIVTHDHALDYELTHALLTRTEIDYVGLIGSATKSRRFFDRLEKDGLSAEDQKRVRCPVGLPSVSGKLPMEIAVSIAAEILSLDAIRSSSLKSDLTWKEIRAAFPPLPVNSKP